MGIAIHKVVRRSNLNEPFNSSALNFTHGVASGDPYPHSVILVSGKSIQWNGNETDIRSGRDALRCMMITTVIVTVTGTAPVFNHETEQYVKISTAPVCVNYNVATDCEMKNVVSSGTAYTSSDIDYTLKVCPKSCSLNLLPDTATLS